MSGLDSFLLTVLYAFSVPIVLLSFGTRMVAGRASFFLTQEMKETERLESTQWAEMHWDRVHHPVSLFCPRVHASCWYLAPQDPALLRELLRISRGRGRKFKKLLPQIASRMVAVPECERADGWRRVMAFSDRPETHGTLASGGASIAAVLISLEHGIPLDYAEAMCPPDGRLNLMTVECTAALA